MSFSTALSGLQAATTDLNITSNNIANVSTTGFKRSRAEFADLVEGSAQTALGSGVQVASTYQQFGQGNLDFTEAVLDLAISGEGFFVVDQNLSGGDVSYTRAGQFGVNADGYITNSNAQYLQAFPVDALGNSTSTSLSSATPIQLPASIGSPQASTLIDIGVNLDEASVALDPANFDPTASDTFSHSTSTTVFDSLGASHIMSYYFIHDLPGSATNPGGDLNQWGVFAYVDGVEVDVDGGTPVTHPSAGLPVVQNMGTLNFNPDGSFLSNTPAPFQTTGIAVTNGANPLAITHDFANNSTTQFSSDFSVNTLDSDGFTTGRLTGLEISEEGIIRANFSNGISTPLGQIALGDFPNVQGLQNIGSASWNETIDSGAVITGTAGTGRLGQITSGALETANVDLTSQLVNLITAQRNFQANARSIETTNAITDTIIQIR